MLFFEFIENSPTIIRNSNDARGDNGVMEDVTGGNTEAPIVDIVVVTETSESGIVDRLKGEGYQTNSVGTPSLENSGKYNTK